MNNTDLSYRIISLGDTAITIDFGNCIDIEINKTVLKFFSSLQQQPLTGMIEVVPAYSSVTIYYEVISIKKIIAVGTTAFDWMKEKIIERLRQPIDEAENISRHVKIPVCYENEFATDIIYVAEKKKLTVDEIINIHSAPQYNVYMLGFLPGFAYMGQLDEKIEMPRKPQPENTLPGSVGIAGRQTGIYSLHSPGGWYIIGRTPIKLFDADKEEPTLLRAGDIVKFYSITKMEFEKIAATQ